MEIDWENGVDKIILEEDKPTVSKSGPNNLNLLN